MKKHMGVRSNARRRTKRHPLSSFLLSVALGTCLAGWLFAHGGEDHGTEKATPAPVATGDGIRVTKEQQFTLGMLTERPSARSLMQSVSVAGKIVPRTDAVADVVPSATGRITGGRIPQLGERVRKGEVLFRIAQVLAPSERASIQGELIRAKAELASAEREVSRMERLDGVVAGKQIVEAKIRRDAAKEGYSALSSQLRGGNGTTPVTAPISGIITKADIAEGENVDGTRAVYTIADLSKVWVEASLFEGDVAGVKGATSAIITTPSYPAESFVGTLYRMGSTVDAASRTITALFAVSNREEMLKLDMSATGAITTGNYQAALSIPKSAIIRSGTRTVVFVHTATEQFAVRDVVLGGGGDGEYVEVRSGLSAQDRVLISGSYELKSLAGLPS